MARDATLSAIRHFGGEETLDNWLRWNFAEDVFDAELLEIIPPQFREEYSERLRLHSEFENRFAAQLCKPTGRTDR